MAIAPCGRVSQGGLPSEAVRIAILNWSEPARWRDRQLSARRHPGAGSTRPRHRLLARARRAARRRSVRAACRGALRGRSNRSGWIARSPVCSEWRPQVLFSHGLLDPEVEARTLQIAPAVFLAHAYYGTCISGAKMFKSPTNMPCSRTFGWPCLANYYPRRCGGWSPITMVREFRRQSARLELLSQYKAIVTLSSHMQREYARHGLGATWVRGAVEPGVSSATDVPDRRPHDEYRLLFVGRMDHLKGGDYLLDALPRVASALDRTLNVTFVGDGPARASWQAAAATTGDTRAEASHRVSGLARQVRGRCAPRGRRSARRAQPLARAIRARRPRGRAPSASCRGVRRRRHP